ncbi:piggyBac transposable element-derived protein 4-like [Ptychodera flava]|uniref:piggyBac transposable element-derived protein 4-like n=1 Tax=Ptychodera flava TaxID=63121 RepID=UPI003969DFA6
MDPGRANAEVMRIFMEDDDEEEFLGFPDVETASDIDVGEIDAALRQVLEFEDGELQPEAPDNLREIPWSADLENFDLPNFVVAESGPNHRLGVGAQPLDYFFLLIPPSFLQLVVDETNRYATQSQRINGADPYWYETKVDEMRAFIAVNILMGIHTLPDVNDYWSTDDRLQVPGIAKVLPKNRYKKLSQYFHINNNELDLPAGDPNRDRMFKVRPLLDLVHFSFAASYVPFRELSIDEAMVKFKGHSYMIQYMPAKPVKWGFKVWMLACPRTGYCLSLDPYTGKKGGQTRVSRRPPECEVAGQRKRSPAVWQTGGNIMARQAHSQHLVNIIAARNNNNQTESGDVSCPKSVIDYNKFMGGVDLSDQLATYYPLGGKHYKYWKYLFWFIINRAICNAWIMYKIANTPPPRHRYRQKDFRLDLSTQLVAGFTARKRPGPPAAPVLLPSSLAAENLPCHECVRIDTARGKKTCVLCSKLGKKTASGRGVQTSWMSLPTSIDEKKCQEKVVDSPSAIYH